MNQTGSKASEGKRSEKWRIAARGTETAVIVLSVELTVLEFNNTAAKLYGYRREEVVGKSFLDLVPASDRELVRAELSRMLLSGESKALETWLSQAGEERIIEWTLSRVLDAEGEPICAIAVSVNLPRLSEESSDPQQARLDKKIQDAQKMESLAVLAGGIAHDFNNLLVGILGGADLALLSLPATSPACEHLEIIRESAVRASELSKQMLAYSGKGQFLLKKVSLSDVLRDTAHLLEVSVGKRAALKYDLEKNLPLVEVDVTQIRQLTMNLVTNASEAIGDELGVITIVTGAIDCSEAYLKESYGDWELGSGRYVYLEISDNGCGIDEAAKPRIFEPFFTTKFTGRGLGLAAVIGIVRGHRGAVRVYSEPGRGTSIKVLLPADRSELHYPQTTVETPFPGKRDTLVLVVDDDETVRLVTGAILERAGYRVVMASDGRDAVDIFKRRQDEIGIVLLDMTMPVMGGEESFRELRQINPRIPVVLSSGYNEQEATNRFVGKGLAGFVQKPFDARTLLAKLDEALRAKDFVPGTGD
jgi:PAS domain S-box-containing protein